MGGGTPLHHRFAAVPLPKHSLGRIQEPCLFLPKFHLGRGTVRRTVEGHTVASLRNDVTDDIVQIAKHVAGRDSHYRDTMLRQKGIAPRIALGPIRAPMNLAIHFHRQPSRRAVKVQHIRPRRMLPPKPQPLGSFAKDAPKNHLGQRHLAPQSPCASHRPAGLRRYPHCPSTMLRMVPLPKHSLGRNEVETHV